MKPVEGPRGPHLFRGSRSSVDFTFDSPFQMSPVLSKSTDMIPQTELPSPKTTVQPVTPPKRTRPELQRSISYDPEEWTVGEVAEYMSRSDVAHEIIKKLELHDINGSVLMHMQFDDLKELDIPSFGKRHQLWSAIQALKEGPTGPSPMPTPFQDITRPCSSARSNSNGDIPCSPCSDSPTSPLTTPVSYTGHKKRRTHRKHRRPRGEIEPGESVSIVAIEQLIPKPHECSKGQQCSTWQKRERILEAIRMEQSSGETGWAISPTIGGHIMITGDPGNAETAENLLSNIRREENECRPTSEFVPSVVASSDLLGPGQLPEFSLHERTLQRVEHRDPQENVKQFLNFQHVASGHVNDPSTPPFDMFPAQHYQSYTSKPAEFAPFIPRPGSVPLPHRPSITPTPQSLPELLIPRSASANPYLAGPSRSLNPSGTTFSPSRAATVSPTSYMTQIQPFASLGPGGRPGSELDVPVTAMPTGPIPRDNSQSVPPDMQYRDSASLQRSSSRAEWRRPSFAMPKLDEERVFSGVTTVPPTRFPAPNKQQQKAQDKAQIRVESGADVSHAGWMKKRKAKLLRHDWQDAHFRLHGTQLDMHESNRLSATLVETIDVDEYSVTVSTAASNSKISSALKSLKITNNTDKRKEGKGAVGDGSFVFQLIPGDKDRTKFVTGKTHHFAVANGNERIDWMRELMLAKAKKQRENGYTIEHNGMGVI